MADFIKALAFVVVAEMGDKTQLLAMAMASKFKASQVMLGVLVATILNHALAVALGSYLSSLIPMDTIKIVAAISFLIFGLWTLRGDKIDDENEKKHKFGPVVTVTIAFFLAEMGDKTQLMTIAISADSKLPLFVLAGTTTGMLIADGLGILGGSWLGKHVPDKYIKWGAGMIFIFFGILTLYKSVPEALLSPVYIILFAIVLAVLIYLIGVKYTYNGQADKNEINEK